MASSVEISPESVHSARPGFGVTLARGAGWGSLLGAAFGVFVAPVDDLLTFHDDPFSGYSFLLGFYTAPFGLMYGLVAGLLSALCFLPFASWHRSAVAARVIATVIGPVVVAAISFLTFHPSMSIGGNETSEHVRERLVLFYIYPCAVAALSGLIAGGRLARPTQGWCETDTPDGLMYRRSGTTTPP